VVKYSQRYSSLVLFALSSAEVLQLQRQSHSTNYIVAASHALVVME